MKIIQSPLAANRVCNRAPRKLVLVPTMGALHEGHLTLIRKARRLAGKTGTVAVSIFVNPTQFGPKEDFSRYPRPFEKDAALCKAEGTDILFHPEPSQMYQGDASTHVQETTLELQLCGRSRPGHFRGVCTVVAKLFNIIQPDIAVFGEKDFQQLAVISRMVRDLNFPVKIVGVPTVRETDGLAMSSRNQYLSPEERAEAPVIRAALLAAKEAGPRVGPTKLRELVTTQITRSPFARIDYVEVMDAETLQPAVATTRPMLIAVAVFFGKTRLIDNIVLH